MRTLILDRLFFGMFFYCYSLVSYRICGCIIKEIYLYKQTDDVSERKDLKNGYPEIVKKMEGYIEEAHIPMKGVRLY